MRDLAFVLIAWAAIGIGCFGWGALGVYVSLRSRVRLDLWMTAIVGFAVVLCLLQLWHLVLPVDWRATAALLGSGAVLSWIFRRDAEAERIPITHSLLVLILALWLAWRGMDYPRNYDSGLYHFASIRWANEFPVVPGLANLHSRLGFNQSYFLWVALLNCHPLWGNGYHVANSFLLFLIAAPATIALLNLAKAPVGRAALFLPAVVHGLGANVSSPSPELAVFVCGAAVLASLLDVRSEKHPIGREHVTIIAICAAGCTVKFSFFAFAVASLAVLLWCSDNRKRTAFISACWLAALMVPYAARGVILSGYPFFPLRLLPAPADWRVPEAETIDTANWIYSWARTPGQHWQSVLGSWDWLGPWWNRITHIPTFVFPLYLSGVGIMLGILLRRKTPSGLLLSWVPIVVGLGVWFFTAPDARFATWLVWLAAAISSVHILSAIPAAARRPAVLLLCGVAVWTMRIQLSIRPLGFAATPRGVMKEHTNGSGLKIWVPSDPKEDRLWDAPLPSAPTPNPQLELQGPSLVHGFRVRR